MYKSVTNTPRDRKRLTFSEIVWKNAFSPEEIDMIDKMCGGDLETSKVVDPTMSNIRRSKVRFIQFDAGYQWVFERLNMVINRVNEDYYNFNLNGYSFIQYTLYDHEDQGMYDWHTDTIFNDDVSSMENNETRKLSVILVLSQPNRDFTGGEFQINIGLESNARTVSVDKGDIILFPSFMIHRVKPVLTGQRKSIVAWVEGPKFI